MHEEYRKNEFRSDALTKMQYNLYQNSIYKDLSINLKVEKLVINSVAIHSIN